MKRGSVPRIYVISSQNELLPLSGETRSCVINFSLRLFSSKASAATGLGFSGRQDMGWEVDCAYPMLLLGGCLAIGSPGTLLEWGTGWKEQG